MTRRVSALLTSFALALGLTVATAAPAYGCSCADVSIEQAIFPETTAAFVGVPVSVRENPDANVPGVWGEALLWTFQVETVLYGELPPVVEVGSGLGGGDCGYDFTGSGRIGVVAYGAPDRLATGICGGVWGADQLIAVHGPGVAPGSGTAAPIVQPARQGPPSWFWWGAGGVAAMALGLVVIARRRRAEQDGWTASNA